MSRNSERVIELKIIGIKRKTDHERSCCIINYDQHVCDLCLASAIPISPVDQARDAPTNQEAAQFHHKFPCASTQKAFGPQRSL